MPAALVAGALYAEDKGVTEITVAMGTFTLRLILFAGDSLPNGMDLCQVPGQGSLVFTQQSTLCASQLPLTLVLLLNMDVERLVRAVPTSADVTRNLSRRLRALVPF